MRQSLPKVRRGTGWLRVGVQLKMYEDQDSVIACVVHVRDPVANVRSIVPPKRVDDTLGRNVEAASEG